MGEKVGAVFKVFVKKKRLERRINVADQLPFPWRFLVKYGRQRKNSLAQCKIEDLQYELPSNIAELDWKSPLIK